MIKIKNWLPFTIDNVSLCEKYAFVDDMKNSSITETDRRIRRERIKFELRSRGLSYAKLSELEGLHKSVFAAVAGATKRSRRAANVIAKAIDTTPEEFWPEIYGGNNEI